MEYYLVYGSRALPTADSKDTRNEARQAKPDTKKPADGPFIKLLDRTFAHPIPHSWFHHFYTCSVVSSLFWGHQILTQGPVLRTLAGNAASPDSKDSMSVNQVVLVWALIAIQGSRRLYESISYRKQSTSRMQFSHWLLGILYYLAVGLEVWIEGSGEYGPSVGRHIETASAVLPQRPENRVWEKSLTKQLLMLTSFESS